MTKPSIPFLFIVYIILFLTTRMINLKSFPIVGDEILHIVRAQLTISGDLFIGIRAGLKQTFIWIAAITFYFSDNHLWISRTISVLSGLINGWICYKLADLFFPQARLGHLAILFYLISPFALFHDRLALTDSLLTTLIGVSLLLSVRLWQTYSVKIATSLGIVFALALLTKTYAGIYLIVPFLLLIFCGVREKWSKVIKALGLSYILVGVLAFIPILYYGQEIYAVAYSKKLIDPSIEINFFKMFVSNLQMIFEWLRYYLTLPLFSLTVFGIVTIALNRDKFGAVLLAIMALNILIFSFLFSNSLVPRYLLPLIVIASVVAAYGIDQLVGFIFKVARKVVENKFLFSDRYYAIRLVIFLFLSIPSVWFSYLILFNPIQAPLPMIDRWQYLEGPYSGYGLPSSARFIQQLADDNTQVSIIYTKSDINTIGLKLHLEDLYPSLDNIRFEAIEDFDETTLSELNAYAKLGPIITVGTPQTDTRENITNFSQELPYLPVKLASYAKPGEQIHVELYQWVTVPNFLVHWLQKTGDANPRVAWHPPDISATSEDQFFVDWFEFDQPTLATMPQALNSANINYVLMEPTLTDQQAHLFTHFVVGNERRLTINKIPPNWYLVYAYPNINCEWCLFQLKPPTIQTKAIFGEIIELEGYDLPFSQLSPGDDLYVTIYWQSLKKIPKQYVVFLHLLDENDQLVGQIDRTPLQGQWPTKDWYIGSKIADRLTLELASDLKPGEYTIAVGLYDPNSLNRLSIDTQQSLVEDNALRLSTIELIP